MFQTTNQLGYFILFHVVSSRGQGLKTCLPRLAPQQAPQQAPAAAKHDAGGRLRRGAWPGRDLWQCEGNS